MSKRVTHIAAWSTTAAAVLAAVLAFPHAAKTAENQRLEASNVAKLEQIQNVDLTHSERFWLRQTADSTTNERNSLVSLLSDSKFNAQERTCLAEAVYYEARSETRSGQRAVAEVVLNRVDNKHFPDTICGVVYEGSERSTGCQFSFTCDGSMEQLPKGKAWQRSLKVAEYVMTGGHAPITNRATHYHTLEVSPPWSQTLRMTRRIDSHVFYRFAPRDYKPSEAMVLVAPPI